MTTAPASSAAVGGEQEPARGGAHRDAPTGRPAAGSAATPAGQADLDRQVGRADVDAQLQARAGDDGPERPALRAASTSRRRPASSAE